MNEKVRECLRDRGLNSTVVSVTLQLVIDVSFIVLDGRIDGRV